VVGVVVEVVEEEEVEDVVDEEYKLYK